MLGWARARVTLMRALKKGRGGRNIEDWIMSDLLGKWSVHGCGQFVCVEGVTCVPELSDLRTNSHL